MTGSQVWLGIWPVHQDEHAECSSFSAAFISLLDNYETSTGMAEVVTPEEIVENNCFLDAVLATEVMKVSNTGLFQSLKTLN